MDKMKSSDKIFLTEGADFADAFGTEVELTEYQRRRDLEIQEEVRQQELLERYREDLRNREETGMVWRNYSGIRRNEGDNSTISRMIYAEQLAVAATDKNDEKDEENENEKQKVPKSKRLGRCSFVRCGFTTLAPDHGCKKCGCGVHNLCAQNFHLVDPTDELNGLFCSELCKNAR